MSCKLLLAICAVVCLAAVTIDAASLRVPVHTDSVMTKLDYEGVQANVRGSRQAYEEDASGEDSDEDDDEDDAEKLQQNIIQQQQAQEQAVNDSQEGSDEDDEDDDDEEEDDDDDESSFLGRRRRRRGAAVETPAEAVIANEIVESANQAVEKNDEQKEEVVEENAVDSETVAAAVTPTPSSPNTNVLILIRDAIKKVTTELPNSQQVATSAQQYFQLFEHFLQQTIEQVIGDDDDEDEVESTTIAPESEASIVPAAVEGDKEMSTDDKAPASGDKEMVPVEAKPVVEVPVSEKQPEKPEIEEAKA